MTEMIKEEIGMRPEIKERMEKIRQGIVPEGYKETEVGIIPENWKTKRLGDISKIVSGGTPKTKVTEYWNGTIMWATPTDITSSKKFILDTDRKITKLGLEKSSAQLLPKNSILMTSRATIGERAINKVPMATNQGFKSLIPNKGTHYEFLYYLIGIYKRRLNRLANGSTFLEISTRDVNSLKVHFPPYKEQQKIADILSTWDRAIELKESLIKEKEEQKKGLMQMLLSENSSIAREETAFKAEKIFNFCKTYSGGTPSRQNNSYYKDGTIPWIKSGELNSTQIYETEEYITLEGLKNSSAKRVSKNNILLALYGATAGVVGLTKIDATINQAILAIIPDESVCNNLYLFHYLTYIMPRIINKYTQGGQPNLNGSIVKNIEIILPTINEQKRIVKILSTIEKEIDLLKQEIELLKEQKKGLMQLLLTGIVRVEEVEQLE